MITYALPDLDAGRSSRFQVSTRIHLLNPFNLPRLRLEADLFGHLLPNVRPWSQRGALVDAVERIQKHIYEAASTLPCQFRTQTTFIPQIISNLSYLKAKARKSIEVSQHEPNRCHAFGNLSLGDPGDLA